MNPCVGRPYAYLHIRGHTRLRHQEIDRRNNVDSVLLFVAAVDQPVHGLQNGVEFDIKTVIDHESDLRHRAFRYVHRACMFGNNQNLEDKTKGENGLGVVLAPVKRSTTVVREAWSFNAASVSPLVGTPYPV